MGEREEIRLWLDDIREPPQGWTWVKTVPAAIQLLEEGRVVEISLDHDLGEDQEEGYAVCLWMAEHGVWPPEGAAVHSGNPPGCERMCGVIESYGPYRRLPNRDRFVPIEPERDDPNKDLVYGQSDFAGGLVFVPRTKAKELASLVTAARESKTWGEFRARIPEACWDEIRENIADPGDPEPEENAEFDPNEIPGWEEYDWPGWPAQLALEWVPESIRQSFGKTEGTMISGDFLDLSEADPDEVVSAFEQAGYLCEEDYELVATASRWDE
jgi:hypothetical protein